MKSFTAKDYKSQKHSEIRILNLAFLFPLCPNRKPYLTSPSLPLLRSTSTPKGFLAITAYVSQTHTNLFVTTVHKLSTALHTHLLSLHVNRIQSADTNASTTPSPTYLFPTSPFNNAMH